MVTEKDKIISKEAINLLAKKYNALDYSVKLVALLKTIYPLENFDYYSKYELHKLLNDILFLNYNGEQVLKYKLFQSCIYEKNLIAAFEIKVNNSRVDFLTINGHTTSFEIKSELDNLSKLRKQMADYMLAFEYNYLVIDERHIERAKVLLPESFGLWAYKNGEYKKLRKAVLNDKIVPEVQLSLLTKRELVSSFPESGGVLKNILNSFDSTYVNNQFKKALKNRYRSRWEFVVANEAQIFPIDLQFFFNSNILPNHIYYH